MNLVFQFAGIPGIHEANGNNFERRCKAYETDFLEEEEKEFIRKKRIREIITIRGRRIKEKRGGA